MARTITPEQLGAAIQEELTVYHADVTKRINNLSKKAAQDLVKITKSTAPASRPSFRNNITSRRKVKGQNGDTYEWGVQAPDYRLTHLLVNGHAAKDGRRVPGNPFLQNALDKVLPEYEENVKEACKE